MNILAELHSAASFRAGVSPVILLAASLFGGAAIADECSDLKEVAKHAANDFEAIVGAATTENHWNAKMNVQGWQSCNIQRSKYTSFTCTSSAYKTRQNATKALEAKAASLKRCLGAGWTRMDTGPFAGFSNFQVKHSFSLNVFPPDMGSMALPKSQEYFVNLNVTSLNRPTAPAEKTVESVTEQPKAFCPDLKAVIEAGRTKFASILGKKSSYGASWAARKQLPDWYDCDIAELDDGDQNSRYYSCELTPFRTLNDASNMLNAVGGYVKECLGEEWSQRRRVSDGKPRLDFESADQDPSVELRVTEDDDAWELKLDVELQ